MKIPILNIMKIRLRAAAPGPFTAALLTVVLTAALPLDAGPQAAPVESAQDRQLVRIDVVVRSDAGAVTDLAREDFRVLDRGRPQDLAVFERVAGTADLTKTVALPRGAAGNRRDWRGAVPASATVILIDHLNTPIDAQLHAIQQLQEFLQSFDRTEGLAVYELGSGGLRILHDFTDSPEGLSEAVASVEPEQSLALESSATVGGFESALGDVGRDPRIGESQSGNTGFDRLAGDYFLNDRIQRTSAALETIARHLEGLRGRRNIMWLSGRFPFAFDPWSRSDLVDEVDDSAIEQLDAIGKLINDANVAIYPVDIRGPGDTGAEIMAIAEQIAGATGGRRFRTNQVDEAIETAIDDSEMVYRLGFYAAGPGDPQARRSVKVEVDRPDTELLYRNGYAAQTAGSAGRPAIAELLTSPLDATGIGLTGLVAPVQGGAGQLELVILVDMADLRLRETDDRLTGGVDVGIMFRASDDGTSYILPPSASPIDLTEEQREALQQTGLVVQRVLDTEGRSGSIRITVQDQASGAAGSLWLQVGAN